jgi:hypothetical protein
VLPVQLRLWRTTPGEIPKCMIVRGMKVASEKNYSAETGSYVPRSDGRMTLEPTTKMAFEDIGHLEWFD